MRRLPLGKVPIGVLEATVLRMTGAPSRAVVTPPRAGLDFCAVRAGDGFLVSSADPVTGVASGIGRYAILVSSNDVATSGNRPQFAETVILMPEGATARDVAAIGRQMDTAAKEVGLSIVGGHTEVTPGLHRPIVVVTVFSFVGRYVSSQDARAGDVIMMTKSAGLEGTAAIATEPAAAGGIIPRPLSRRAGRLLERLSVVDEAVAAFGTGSVDAMHDCTEGGVLGAVFEMSLASGVGFELDESLVPVAPETRDVCGLLSLDPLKLIGSGSLLLAVRKGGERAVERALEGVCDVAAVGRFTKKGRVLVRTDGSRVPVREAPEDELWRAMAAVRGR